MNPIITDRAIIQRLFLGMHSTQAFIASPLRKENKPNNPLLSPASIPIRVSRCAFRIGVPSTAHCNMTFHGRLRPESERENIACRFLKRHQEQGLFLCEQTQRTAVESPQSRPRKTVCGTGALMTFAVGAVGDSWKQLSRTPCLWLSGVAAVLTNIGTQGDDRVTFKWLCHIKVTVSGLRNLNKSKHLAPCSSLVASKI